MKEYLLSYMCDELAILMTGEPKPGYYNHERIYYLLLFLTKL